MRRVIVSDSEGTDQESEVYGGRGPRSENGKNQNRFKWTVEENKKYGNFLYENLHIFNCATMRKKARIFAQLSAFIGSRNTPQVKSHHQKMMKRHKEVKTIIRFMERKLGVVIVKESLPSPQKK